MSHENGIIRKPSINLTADIKAVLGETSNSLSVLCTSEKINWWSRYKPVHIVNTPFPDRSTEWWRGTFGDCGIKPHYLINYGLIKAAYELASTDGHLNGWSYQQPWGGEASPWRAADFDKYYHYAEAPIAGFSCSSQAKKGDMVQATLMVVPGSESDDLTKPGSLTLRDIKAQGQTLENWKFGIVIYDSSGTRRGRVVGTSNGNCSFNTKNLKEGETYTAYPMLALYSMGQDDSDIANGYVTVPFCSPRTFKIVSITEYYGLTITVQGWNLGLQGIRYKVKVTIDSGTFGIYGGYIHLRFTSSADNSSLVIGEWSTQIDEMTVTPSNPLDLDEIVPASFLNMSRPYKLVVQLRTQGGTENRTVALFTESGDGGVIS